MHVEGRVCHTPIFFDKVTVNIHGVFEFFHEFAFLVTARDFYTYIIFGERHHYGFRTTAPGGFGFVNSLPFPEESAIAPGIDQFVRCDIVNV